MKKISSIRKALEHIPDAQIIFPPKDDFLGNQEGVQVDTIWSGEVAVQNTEETVLASDDFHRAKTDRNVDEEGWSIHVPQPEPVFEFGADVDDKKPLLRGEEGQRVKQSIDVKGMDALAGYLSFHVKGAQWGIYIPTSGIAYMVQNVLGELSTSFEIKCRLAFNCLLSHELFHFATDYMVAQWEMVWHEAAWVGMKERKEKSGLRYWEREEKLANAYMLRRLRGAVRATRTKGAMEAMRHFVSQQPSGYRDGGQVRDYQWEEELKLLANDYFFYENGHMFDFPIEFSVFYPLIPRIDWRYCPIHLIHDEHRLEIPKIYLDLFTCIEKLEETAAFVRRLNQLPEQTRRKWHKFKRQSYIAITPGMRPKKWKALGEDAWAFRIDDNYRAHLKFHPLEQKWTALEIGDHAEMGHG